MLIILQVDVNLHRAHISSWVSIDWPGRDYNLDNYYMREEEENILGRHFSPVLFWGNWFMQDDGKIHFPNVGCAAF